MDCSLPGSSVHGIFQARLLEWVAIAFSGYCHMTQQFLGFLKKLVIELPYDLKVPLLGIYPKKTRTERDTCTPMFIAALFIIARTWKQDVHQQTNG